MLTATSILKVARLLEQTGGEHRPFHLDHLPPSDLRMSHRPEPSKARDKSIPHYVIDKNGELKLVIN